MPVSEFNRLYFHGTKSHAPNLCHVFDSLTIQTTTITLCWTSQLAHQKHDLRLNITVTPWKAVNNFPFYSRTNPEILAFGNSFRFCESAENLVRHHICGDVPNECSPPHHKTLWTVLSLAQYRSIHITRSLSFSTYTPSVYLSHTSTLILIVVFVVTAYSYSEYQNLSYNLHTVQSTITKNSASFVSHPVFYKEQNPHHLCHLSTCYTWSQVQNPPNTWRYKPMAPSLEEGTPIMIPATASNKDAAMEAHIADRLLNSKMTPKSRSHPHTKYQHVWYITGPSGCGKSTVAEYVATSLQLPFLEGDNVCSLLISPLLTIHRITV